LKKFTKIAKNEENSGNMIQPPRSRFMITDILSGDARDALIKHHSHYLGLQVNSEDRRSRSPHEPNHTNGQIGERHEDSDSDLSGGSDDHSDMCSNGEFFFFYLRFSEIWVKWG
jgi:hypothetical protein